MELVLPRLPRIPRLPRKTYAVLGMLVVSAVGAYLLPAAHLQAAMTSLHPATCKFEDPTIPVVLLAYNDPTLLRLMVQKLLACMLQCFLLIEH